MAKSPSSPETPRVALLVTCLVDLFRPTVGFAAVKLLQDAGCTVEVPEMQTCCGQPAYNAGDLKTGRELAVQVVEAFADYDYVVIPSGSCAGMITQHYPRWFEFDDELGDQARQLIGRTYELVQFLTDVMGVENVTARMSVTATYHDSCSGLRELGIKQQPRDLLASVEGLSLIEYEGAETCCGFGGTFCVKYPEISDHMVSDCTQKLAAIDAQLVLGGDLGCLMNIAGKLSREGSALQVRHVAEVLAGMTDGPAIAKGRDNA